MQSFLLVMRREKVSSRYSKKMMQLQFHHFLKNVLNCECKLCTILLSSLSQLIPSIPLSQKSVHLCGNIQSRAGQIQGCISRPFFLQVCCYILSIISSIIYFWHILQYISQCRPTVMPMEFWQNRDRFNKFPKFNEENLKSEQIPNSFQKCQNLRL